jgi:predicted anti-sigma-YlaC factor YlaD
MTHLRDTEFVDFAEGMLAASRAAHLEACASCRAQAEEIAAALRKTAAVEMPEPSPLYWDHFSARVHDQVAHETLDRGVSWTTLAVRMLMPLAVAAAVVVAIVSSGLLPRLVQPTPSATSAALAPSHATTATQLAPLAAADTDAAVDAQNAEVWDVLTAAASDMAIDDAHAAGMGIRPGAVDHAVTHMNQAELTELGHLLQTEMKRSSD